jgi:mRNA interferase MazF
MIREGLVVLVPFPYVEAGAPGKVRPAVVVRSLPGDYDDWLICMVSSRVDQAIKGFDEVVSARDDDFAGSGLKVSSVIRISRLAVCHGSALLGSIGQLDARRLSRIRSRLSGWLGDEAT